MKPKLFIGSSYEALHIARSFAKALSDDATTIVWNDAPEFEPSTGTLPILLRACTAYDFGLFVLSPDDKIEYRGAKGKSARDNVLLELGLFFGALGADRTFAVVQTDDKGQPCVKTTSDLAGITLPRFKNNADEHERVSSVNSAAEPIRRKIRKVKVRSIDFNNLDWGFSVSKRSLHCTIPKEEVARHWPQVEGKFFMIVGRKKSDDPDFSEDKQTAKSIPREIPNDLTRRCRLEVKSEMIFKGIGVGDEIELYLLMTPSNLDSKKLENLTVSELVKRGCRPIAYASCRAAE